MVAMTDSKSVDRKVVWVRLPPLVLKIGGYMILRKVVCPASHSGGFAYYDVDREDDDAYYFGDNYFAVSKEEIESITQGTWPTGFDVERVYTWIQNIDDMGLDAFKKDREQYHKNAVNNGTYDDYFEEMYLEHIDIDTLTIKTEECEYIYISPDKLRRNSSVSDMKASMKLHLG